MWPSEVNMHHVLSVIKYGGPRRRRLQETIVVNDSEVTLNEAIRLIIHEQAYKERVAVLLSIMKVPRIEAWIDELRTQPLPSQGYGFLKSWPDEWGLASAPRKKKNHAQADISTLIAALDDDVYADLLPEIRTWVRESPPFVPHIETAGGSSNAVVWWDEGTSSTRTQQSNASGKRRVADTDTSTDATGGERSKAAGKRRVTAVEVSLPSSSAADERRRAEFESVPEKLQMVVHEQRSAANRSMSTLARLERRNWPIEVQTANDSLEDDVGRVSELYLPEDMERARDIHARLDDLDGPSVKDISEKSVMSDRRKSERLALLNKERLELLDELAHLRLKRQTRIGHEYHPQYLENKFSDSDDSEALGGDAKSDNSAVDSQDGYPESMLDKDEMDADIGEYFEVRQDRSNGSPN